MTDDITRRDVLRGLGGLALAGTIGCGREPDEAGEFEGETDQSVQTCSTATIAAVPNQAVAVNHVEAYAEKSVAAGEMINFRVSSPADYTLSIVRLGWDTVAFSDDTGMPVGDTTLHTFPQALASQQPIHPGSYIHVETALNPTTTFAQLTLEVWVRPFRTNPGSYWQGLMSQYKNPGQCGFVLGLTDANVPFCYFGNGGAYDGTWLCTAPSSLSAMQWHHVVAVFNAGTTRLYVDGTLIKSITPVNAPSRVTPGGAPLRIGAYGDSTGTSFFLDGDVAMPTIYSRAISASEIATRAGVKPPQVPNDPAVIGCWPLNEEIGPNVTDASGCGRTGTIVNRGTWMIGGPGFDARRVDRYAGVVDDHAPYNPDTDPTRGHALRLSWTDLYDCGWLISQSYTLPSDCLPGVYVGRIIYTDPSSSVTRRYDVTFVVRVATSRPHAPVLVLCATNTWHAYNNALQLHSFYDNHAAGQPGYYQGFEMPWTSSADPYLQFDGSPTTESSPGYGHLVRAERLWHVWLERNGYDYDVISDRDLDSNPSILSNYKTLFIVGHSEYWTARCWSAVQGYVASGGHLVAASGNTMFWRVSYDNSVIECRKLPWNLAFSPPPPPGQPPVDPCDWLHCGTVSGSIGPSSTPQWGELYHEHDHRRGGLMREAGYPAWQVTGLDTAFMGVPLFSYKVTDEGHALFHAPEQIDVSYGQQLGGIYGVGHETDATLQSLSQNPETGQPLLPLPPAVPASYTTLKVLAQASNSIGADYRLNWWTYTPGAVVSEIVEWVWSGGGRVFSAGSIAAGQAVHDDEKMSALFRNALHANGVQFKLNVMAIGQDGHFDMKAFDGSTWSTGWTDLGSGFANNPPTGVQWAPNSLAAMAIASDGHFYYYYNTGSGWSPVNDYGYGNVPFVGRPAAVGWGRNRLDLFARDTNAHVWQKSWDGSTFGSWVDLGGSVATDPAAVNWRGRLLSLAVLNTSGNAMYRLNSNGNWGDWTNLGGVFASAPTMVFSAAKRMNMFAVDSNGVLWWNASDPVTTNDTFGGWASRGSPPSVALNGRVQVVCWGEGNAFTVFGIGVNGHLYGLYWDGSNWGSWTDLGSGLGGPLIGEPAVASYRGGYISVLCTATNGHIQHLLWNGSAWQAWQDFGGPMRQSPAVFRWVG